MNRINPTLTREQIRRVACPVCKAPPGDDCSELGTGERRVVHHKERVRRAQRVVTAERRPPEAIVAARRAADKLYWP